MVEDNEGQGKRGDEPGFMMSLYGKVLDEQVNSTLAMLLDYNESSQGDCPLIQRRSISK